MQQESGGRATAEETIHLTLAFLGEADPGKAVTAARGVTANRFDLPIDAAKYWRHNKIVWVGPAALPSSLEQLVARLHSALRAAAFVLEERPFAAHITLIRKASPPRSIPPLPRVEWPAPEFVLVRSTPTGKGSRYDVVERFALA